MKIKFNKKINRFGPMHFELPTTTPYVIKNEIKCRQFKLLKTVIAGNTNTSHDYRYLVKCSIHLYVLLQQQNPKNCNLLH